jgi:hypothetical protein
VKKVASRVDQSPYLLWTEYGRQSFAELEERDIFSREVSAESLEIEETQCGGVLPDGVRRQLLVKQMRVILPDVFSAEHIR